MPPTLDLIDHPLRTQPQWILRFLDPSNDLSAVFGPWDIDLIDALAGSFISRPGPISRVGFEAERHGGTCRAFTTFR